MEILFFDIDIIQEDSSIIYVVETHEEIDEVTLAASWLADQCHLLFRVDGDVEVLKYPVIISWGGIRTKRF